MCTLLRIIRKEAKNKERFTKLLREPLMIRRRRAGYLSVLFYIVNIISDVKLYLKKCTELLLKKKTKSAYRRRFETKEFSFNID